MAAVLWNFLNRTKENKGILSHCSFFVFIQQNFFISFNSKDDIYLFGSFELQRGAKTHRFGTWVELGPRPNKYLPLSVKVSPQGRVPGQDCGQTHLNRSEVVPVEVPCTFHSDLCEQERKTWVLCSKWNCQNKNKFVPSTIECCTFIDVSGHFDCPFEFCHQCLKREPVAQHVSHHHLLEQAFLLCVVLSGWNTKKHQSQAQCCSLQGQIYPVKFWGS